MKNGNRVHNKYLAIILLALTFSINDLFWFIYLVKSATSLKFSYCDNHYLCVQTFTLRIDGSSTYLYGYGDVEWLEYVWYGILCR